MGFDTGRAWRASFLSLAVAALVLATAPLGGQEPATHWVSTWAMAPVGRPPLARGEEAAVQADASLDLRDRTLRQIVRVSAGGSRVRIAVSNAFGTAPLWVARAAIGMQGREARLFPGTRQFITFAGSDEVEIPAGGTVVSDPVDFEVFRLTDMAVDLYLPEGVPASSPTTMHPVGLQSSYISQVGDFVGVVSLPVAATTESWFLVTRVEVEAPASVGAVVAFGDSITDGTRSTLDMNARWTNTLAVRLAERDAAPMAVVNAGISGNRVLSAAPDRPQVGVSALDRFERDVLQQAGVTHVVVLEGINDIGVARTDAEPSAEAIIAGHQQLIDRAHAAGLTIYGATLLPFEGAGYFTDVGEAKRQAVNAWIRTSGAYDGVIDFDALMRDARNPARMQSAYDSGDRLHPGDAGYRAMGAAVDLDLFPARVGN